MTTAPRNQTAYFLYITRLVILSNDVTIPAFFVCILITVSQYIYCPYHKKNDNNNNNNNNIIIIIIIIITC